jgi:hypothetical protein
VHQFERASHRAIGSFICVTLFTLFALTSV